MKKLHVTLNGLNTLMMHSPKTVNPLHPLALELKKYTSKRKKTEDDLQKISELEWEAGLYWDDKIGLYMPGENVEACIREGAKARRKGKDIVKGFVCEDLRIPLDYGERLTKEQLMSNYEYRDVRCMKVQRSRIMRTRPRFDTWNISFVASYDENVLDFREVCDAIEYAGRYVGLCDSRPKYGKFVSKVEELN